ncbi:MAG: hypothetical protein NXY57DRAFT_1017313 [Lentinula lateritia]|nr:MAG: hypothetical protein NXY57DRAFT_1017313 [Lentinula lateritia]
MKQSLPWNVLQPVPVPGCPWLSLGHRTLVGNEQPPSIDAARQLNSIDYLHIHKNLAGTLMSLNATELAELGTILLFHTSHIIGILPEMVIYGIYTTLFTISTYIMVQRGFDSLSRKILLGLSTFMYTITTLYMAASIANIIQLIQTLFFGFSTHNITNIFPLFNAIFLVNYSLADGVVVWRAWALCRSDHRIAIDACIFFLCCVFLSEMSTIAIRIILVCTSPSNQSALASLERAINITQVSNLGLSLITNLIATGTVSFKAWCLRNIFVSGLRPHRAGKILVLIVESGIIYSISLIIILVAMVIPLPLGTLGELCAPVNLQFAGIYPLIVLIVLNRSQTLDNAVTVFHNDHTDRPVASFTTIVDTESWGSDTVVTEL